MTSPFFNEDHESIREMARDFANKTLAPIAAEIDKTDAFPPEVAQQMADLGFFGLKIPEEYGGLGLDMRSYVSVMEEIAKKCATATLFISSANSLSTAPIVLSGTEEQKETYLPGVVSGEAYIAFGLTEPGAGSDAASLSTKAVEDGDSYILNGRKCFITFAPLAKYAVIYAKTSPEKGAKGISAFIVDMSLPGVSCGKHEEKMGQRGVPVSDILLEDVRIPKECLLGEKDLGFINAMKTLSVGRIGVASMCLGIAQEAIDLAVNHTKNRVQFGKPLCKNQALAFMLADMETKLNAARLLVYNAAWLMDNGQPVDKAASMAKYFAAEAAIDIVNKSLQLHGGYGYSQEYEIERLYRDVRITSIYEGSSQVQQMVISGKLLK
ncbi:acyl-CoA dehydrogenase family protein [Pseudoflavonifractor phocaeensis]|uniref:acyl-CoA dehydrogenase family protein n=1 Tax=Pseudoflavonifractor phocaeensis TaxID=1870988 RepID=UPI001957423C|nr:acyl-CoA dehydrogenase family protein [Pseudoflavonifractor phocaeensis]MBM6937482.1 acyl-CoA dehydrogenase family protein [Pseudoflavonifractor phocaeensis]